MSVPSSCKYEQEAISTATSHLSYPRSKRRRSQSASTASAIEVEDGERIMHFKPFAAPCEQCHKMTPYRCKGCQSAYYCSRECQREHRRVHVISCIPPKVTWVYRAPKPSATSPSSHTELTIHSAVQAVGTSTAQSLVETFERSVDADCCCICMLEYQRGAHAVSSSIPRRLPCGHVFCTGCLKRCVIYGQVKCPTCFRFHNDIAIDDLPVNEPGIYVGPVVAGEAETYPTSSSSSTMTNTPTYDEVDQESLNNLMDMGFEISEARTALKLALGNVETAVGYLFDPTSMPTSVPMIGPSLPEPLSKQDGYDADDDSKATTKNKAIEEKDAIELKESSGFMSSDVIKLMDMGFEKVVAQSALKQYHFDFDLALGSLVGGFGGDETFDANPNSYQAGDFVEVRDRSDDCWQKGVVEKVDKLGPCVMVECFKTAYHWDFIRKYDPSPEVVDVTGDTDDAEGKETIPSPCDTSNRRRSSLPSTSTSNPMLSTS
jgi:hypothetical protein